MSDALWSLVAALEAAVPLDRHRVTSLLAASSLSNTFELQSATSLTVRFRTPPTVDPDELTRRFGEMTAVPGPPPGYGPPDAAGAYIVQRSWGQLWFAFRTGYRLGELSLAIGASGSPGV